MAKQKSVIAYGQRIFVVKRRKEDLLPSHLQTGKGQSLSQGAFPAQASTHSTELSRHTLAGGFYTTLSWYCSQHSVLNCETPSVVTSPRSS